MDQRPAVTVYVQYMFLILYVYIFLNNKLYVFSVYLCILFIYEDN